MLDLILRSRGESLIKNNKNKSTDITIAIIIYTCTNVSLDMEVMCIICNNCWKFSGYLKIENVYFS